MVTAVLLAVIYLSFISLGLPDSILGVSVPAMQTEFGFPLSFGGLVSMTVVGSTIISSFSSSFIIRKFGTGKVTFASCLLTAVSLMGFSVSPSCIWLAVFAVPLGLGGGSVDTALNNYVALHFKASHMNWLHSFWGLGATLGPVMMSFFIASSATWRSGYRAISIIQIILSLILFMSFPLWRMHKSLDIGNSETDMGTEDLYSAERDAEDVNVSKIRGVKYSLLTFLFYCALEHSAGLWGSSYLVIVKGASLEGGAFWMAFYYGGITAGRFFSGFFSFRFSNPQMIRGGLITALAGSIFLFFPFPAPVTGCSFVLIGLGLAPVFPAMLHETPLRFGKKRSQEIIGYQMGFGYTGSAFLPLLLGIVLQNAGMPVFPYFIAFTTAVILFFSSRIDKSVLRGSDIQ